MGLIRFVGCVGLRGLIGFVGLRVSRVCWAPKP